MARHWPHCVLCGPFSECNKNSSYDWTTKFSTGSMLIFWEEAGVLWGGNRRLEWGMGCPWRQSPASGLFLFPGGHDVSSLCHLPITILFYLTMGSESVASMTLDWTLRNQKFKWIFSSLKLLLAPSVKDLAQWLHMKPYPNIIFQTDLIAPSLQVDQNLFMITEPLR